MFYLDKLKTTIEEIAAAMEKAYAEIHSDEFKARNPDYTECAQAGALAAHIKLGARDLRGMPSWYLDQAAPEIAFMERLRSVCESLGIYEDNLADMEMLTTDPRYRSERSDLSDSVKKALDEVRDDQIEREHDNAITMLEAAGFAENPDDGYEYGRAEDGQKQRVAFEWKREENRYEFTLEVNGVETLRGHSGEFASILSAVGITQEVPAK